MIVESLYVPILFSKPNKGTVGRLQLIIVPSSKSSMNDLFGLFTSRMAFNFISKRMVFAGQFVDCFVRLTLTMKVTTVAISATTHT